MPVCADVRSYTIYMSVKLYAQISEANAGLCTKGTERQTLNRWISAKHEQTLKMYFILKRCHSHRMYNIRLCLFIDHDFMSANSANVSYPYNAQHSNNIDWSFYHIAIHLAAQQNNNTC